MHTGAPHSARSSLREGTPARVRTPYATQANSSGGARGHGSNQRSQPQRRGKSGQGSQGNQGSRGGKERRGSQAGRQDARKHSVPVFDIYGRQLPPGKGSGLAQPRRDAYHTVDGRPHLPRSWTGTPAHRTRQDVQQARRKDFLPHPSFDLDGDGVVNQRDYFFAKRFDKDGDGRLNAKEWAAAQAALRKGYADKFHVVTGGPAKVMAHRVLQKRGHVLMEEKESWSRLHTTFGAKDLQPASRKAPFAGESQGGAADADPRHRTTTAGVSTQSQLRKVRRNNNVAQLRDFAGEPQAPEGIPSPLAERAKVATATRRSQLLRNRRRAATLEALAKQDLPVADVTAQPFQDFVTQRLQRTAGTQRATSRTQLMQARNAQFRQEAARMAPTKPPGVHTVLLPSHATKAKQALDAGQRPPMWWKDKEFMRGVPPQPWEEPLSARRARARRETAGQHAGELLACTGTLKRDAVLDDPFKRRTITPAEVASRSRRRRELSKKPNEVRPVVPGTSVRRSNDGRPHTTKPRRKRWTDFVIEFQNDASNDNGPLDANGKALPDPAEYEPMFSSFTRTGVFDGRVGTARATTSASRRSQPQSDGQSHLDFTYGRAALTALQEQQRAATAAATMPNFRQMSTRSGFGPSASQPVFGGVPSRRTQDARPSTSGDNMSHQRTSHGFSLTRTRSGYPAGANVDHRPGGATPLSNNTGTAFAAFAAVGQQRAGNDNVDGPATSPSPQPASPSPSAPAASAAQRTATATATATATSSAAAAAASSSSSSSSSRPTLTANRSKPMRRSASAAPHQRLSRLSSSGILPPGEPERLGTPPAATGAGASAGGPSRGAFTDDTHPTLQPRPSTSAGVRAGGFQRLLSTGQLRHSVSTPLLAARAALEQ